jgi:cytochrome-b5 reductase
VIVIFVLGYFRWNDTTNGSSTLKSFKLYNDVSRSLQRERQLSEASNDTDDDFVLSTSQFRSFRILNVTHVSPNTKLLRFELPAGKSLGLTVGRHVSLRAVVDGVNIIRAYTPTSHVDQVGYFDLLIKSYEYGKMSSFLHSLGPGSTVDVRGPLGRFKYTINGYPHIGLIAGGTGLTPCLQLVRTILQCPEYKDDNTRLTLLFQNRCEQDILLYDELEQLRKTFTSRLQLSYFVSNAQTESFATPTSKSADAEVRGYIQQSSISSLLAPEVCPLVCICGPSGFNEAMKKFLTATGHNDETVFVW